MGVNLLADEPAGINLLAEEMEQKPAKKQSFYDLSKDDQAKALELAKQQISEQYPNMPNWLRDMMLTITPKDESPRLKKIADIAQQQTNFIPVAAGGAMQGFATPFQGIASLLPGETAKNFANEDFTRFLPGPQNGDEQALQKVAEFAGGFGPVGKMFGLLKGAGQAAKLPKMLQNAAALAGTGALATPGDAFDKTLGAAGGLALGGAGKLASKAAEKVPPFLRGLMNDSTNQSLVESVQKPYDVLSNTADQLYNYVRNQIGKRNISIPLKPEYFDDAKAILPKTRASQQLIDKAKTGDYDAIHDLQSHLYKKGTKALASDDVAMENQGEEIIELRNKINDDLKNHLVQSGNVDIAHVLDQGKNVYRQMMDTYFNKNLPKSIGKLVHPEMRLVPEDPTTIFNQNSVPMKKFLQQHPEAGKHVQNLQEKEAASKALSKILWGSAGVGGSIYGGKTLYDFLK